MNVQLEVENNQEKKRIILENMLDLIDEHGLMGVPMSLLAKRAGIAAGTIYHYFDSKDTMIMELFEYVRKTISDQIFKIKDLTSTRYEVGFKCIWINLYHYFTQNPKVLSFMEQFFSSPFQRMIHSDQNKLYEDHFKGFFQRAIRDQYIKPYDINIIACLYMGGLISAAKQHNNGFHTFTEEKLADMADILWEGLRSRSN
ncbi:TetR/AcrR family transcriptional regulator [Olivibacter ginsenosidimutans]|uniref:TetR/AcrR family transcriptional regulator n=1 Tax=Olivibacter ginsenosidimutans TaxID=1176537 RepID=A0ABP9AYZ3_9SPHI